jgi:hypothetical protein
MDCIRLTLLALLLTLSTRAQTFSEWFKQKSTQKKYLLQQIAVLQIYSGYLKTGYGIAKGRLGSITAYVGNEYDLHDGYYRHLNTVSVPVKNNPQVKDILHWQQDILKETTAIKKQPGLTSTERAYTGKVCDALLSDCDARLSDLQNVLTDSKAEMSDEERIRQITRLHGAMQDNHRFAASFYAQLQLYVRNKQQEKNDITTLTHLYANR